MRNANLQICRLARDKIETYESISELVKQEENPVGLSNVLICCTCCNLMVRYQKRERGMEGGERGEGRGEREEGRGERREEEGEGGGRSEGVSEDRVRGGGEVVRRRCGGEEVRRR